MKTYTVVFFGSALLAIFTMPIVTRLARRFGLVDRPGVRKVHSSPVPRIGGVVLVLATLALTIPVFMLDNTISEAFEKVRWQIITLLIASFAMFLMGLIDDTWGLRARWKLLGQLVAASVVCAFGMRIDSIGVGEGFEIELGLLAWPLTIFWIVGITNAVNLIDGLDGLAGGIAAVTCGVIAVFAMISGLPVMAVLMLALLGSLIGFLFFNFNPAKVFMGDCGTMFIGFMLAASSLLCVVKTATFVAVALPAIVLGMPILDTFFSILRRILERRSVFAPDRKHIHHRLLALGLNQRYAVLLVYLVTLVAGLIGMCMLLFRAGGAVVVFLAGCLLLLVVFRLIGAVRLRESIEILRRNWMISQHQRKDTGHFEEAQLRMREATSFREWWRALCRMAGHMDFARLAISVRDDSEGSQSWSWSKPGEDVSDEDLIVMRIPVSRGRLSPVLRIDAAIKPNGSFESVGHRAELFGRLIDESLPSIGPEPPQRRKSRRLDHPQGSHLANQPSRSLKGTASQDPELVATERRAGSASNADSAHAASRTRDQYEKVTGDDLQPLAVMGLTVVPFESYSHAVDYVKERVSKKRKCFCVAINPEKTHRAAKDPRLLAAIKKADMTLCDGIGIALATRLLHGRSIRRCTGCDFFFRLVDAAAREGWRVFLLGATRESNDSACARLRETFPGLRIAGNQDGYFTDSQPVIEQINRSKADLLFVAMGSPRQELWIAENREAIDAPFCMGVGGSFDVAGGQARRAPAVFRKTGTEFLYRLVSEPSRWRRQLALPLFAMKVLKARLASSASGPAEGDV